jgi:hypothetical protein
MQLGLMTETYAVIVFLSQISILKPLKIKRDDPSLVDLAKSMVVHVAGLGTMRTLQPTEGRPLLHVLTVAVCFPLLWWWRRTVLVREPIWLFILYNVAGTHVPEAATTGERVVFSAISVVLLLLLYLDYNWSSYHAGQLCACAVGGIEAN